MRKPSDPKLTHECIGPGCTTRLPPRLLACRRHWWKIPAELRNEISTHYRPGQTAATASPEYLDALARVVEHLQGAAS